MPSDNTVGVKIDADVSGLKQGASQAGDASETISQHLERIRAAAESGGSALDQAGEDVSRFGTQLKEAAESSSNLTESLKTVGEVALGVFAGGGLEDMVEKVKDFFTESIFGAAELGEKLSNLSLSTGISTNTLQELRLAAQLTGGNFDILQRSVSQLSLKMLELASGQHNAALETAIADLGLTPAQLEDSEHALDNLAEAIHRVGISQRTIGDVSEILGGRGGATFIPILAHLDEAKQKMDELHLALDPGQVQANAAAQEKVNLLGAAFTHLKETLGTGLTGLLGGVSDYLTRQVALLSLTTEEYNRYVAAIRAGASAAEALREAGLQAGGANPLSGFSNTGARGGGWADIATEIQPAIESQKQLAASAKETQKAESDMARMVAADARDMATQSDEAWGRIVAWHKEEAAEAAKAAKEDQQSWDDLGKQTLDVIKAKWQALQDAAYESAQQQKADAEIIASAITPITSAFEQSFTGVIQGTQTLQQAWKRMLDSMGLELLKSGLHDLLLGGATNTIGGAIFGVTGQGGGIAGQIAQAFQGSAIQTALKSSLTGAWTGIEGVVQQVFGTAFNSISSTIKNVFGSAFSGLGGAAGSAGASAAGGAASNVFQTMATHLGTIAGSAAQTVEQLLLQVGEAVAQTALLGILAVESTAKSVPIIGTFLEHGGVIPSAAGGMVLGGGGTFAILHPREMVLPANLSEGIQRAIAGGTFGGGDGGGTAVSVSFNISAIDGASVRNFIESNRDMIGDAVISKIRDGRTIGQSVSRGIFRR